MKSIFPLLLLCVSAHGAVCPTGQRKDSATLVQVEHMWLQSAEQHDTAVLSCILAVEFEEADFECSSIDRDATLVRTANRDNAGNVHSELSDLHAHVYGDFAYVRGLGVACSSFRHSPKDAARRRTAIPSTTTTARP